MSGVSALGSERPGLGSLLSLPSIVAVNLKCFEPAQSYQGRASVVDDEST